MNALVPSQRVVVARRPFGMDVVPLTLPAGLTIAEMIDLIPDLPEVYRDALIVHCGDQGVPAELWPIARPREGVTLTISVRLGDGGNILRTLALIAVAVAATLVTGGALAPFLGSAFAAGGIGAAVAGAAIGLGGALLVNTLFRAPTTQQQGLDGGGIANSASLSGNLLGKARPLPRICGERRVSPPLVSSPITELVGDDVYAEAVFALAGPHRLRNPRLGDTLAGELADLQIEMREGRPTDDPLTLVTRQGFQSDAEAVTLSDHKFDPATATNLINQADPSSCLPQWHRVTSREAPDEIWLLLTMPEGLFDDDAPDEDRIVPVRFRFRLAGTSTWHNAPEIHLRNRRAQLFRKTARFIWGTAPVPLPTAPTTGGPVLAWRSVPAANVTGAAGISGWTAHSHFASGAGLRDVANVSLEQDRVVFWLDAGTFPKGRYEIEVMHGHQIVATTLNTTTYGYASTLYDFFGFYVDTGVARVIDDLLGRHMKIEVSAVTSIWDEHPVPGTDCALVAVKGKNRRFNALTVEAAGYVKDYDETTQEWTDFKVTSNPAPHLRDVLAGELNKDGRVPADLIDDAALVAWRAFCAENSLEVNAVFEGMSNQRAREVIAAAGYGEPRQSDKWGVIWEYDRAEVLPVQLFTPRNSRGASFSKAFQANPPDAFIVSFADRDRNYEQRQIVVHAPWADPGDPDLVFEEVFYEWEVTEAGAEARALLDLKMGRYRDTLFEREVAWDGRLCIRGDLVAVQDEVWDRITSSAWIKQVLVNDSDEVVQLVLDAAVDVIDEALFNEVPNVSEVDNVRLLGLSPAVSIRLGDGTLIHKTLLGPTGAQKAITFAEPFAMPTADFGSGAEPSLTAGMLVSVGAIGLTYRRCLVTAIERRSEASCVLNLLDEAPQIHG